VELQANLPTLAATGILPFALSYDPVPVLAAFAATHGITYPLLSDDGSRFIRALGILNTSLAPTDEHYGVAYPGTYVIAEDGRVADKVFHVSHRTRDAAVTAMRERLGLKLAPTGPRDWQVAKGLIARATMDSGEFVRGERVGLQVTIGLGAGVHIYGQPLPEGLLPTTLEVAAPATVTVEPVVYPPPRPLRTAWLDEELLVYEGRLTLATGIIFAEQREDVIITATLRFQACIAEECFVPERLTFRLPMRFRPFPT
jgi:hypothetical protein